ncbi:guanylate kinase [Fructobacillus pseudoficulneus]|uniref:Guanylate kinase n=1 Tax=Fructobacillus pseudoficulneus TaxID=220714 RepID=A0A3F3GWR7_9LACO|nr:guanylate kinase [Fructobacillus pseudoficulneus]GAP03184.1 guanylate kinase [Fructobacillus pseudoficulneus]SEH40772.1 guanylate kinase [Fructobacillus pseudoficulneus]
MSEKRVIVLTGPAGAGKTSIATYLKEKWGIPQVITHTTRAKRTGEVDGVDYYFETEESFPKNHYLESVHYGQANYGSSIEGLEKAWQENSFASIVLDTKGAETYLSVLKEQAWVWYVTIQDLDKLEKRLVERGDHESEVKKRLNSAEFRRDLTLPKELAGHAEVLVNDEWQLTCQRVDTLIKGSKHS